MAMNFTSTGNNFGAGQIAFKSHQEANFVVLNAKFTYNPENADYQAADVACRVEIHSHISRLHQAQRPR